MELELEFEFVFEIVDEICGLRILTASELTRVINEYCAEIIVETLLWIYSLPKLQNYEAVKGGCIPSRNMFRTQKQ